MSHYEDVVIEYLRADRSLFLNTQCCIQLHPGDNPDTSGPHWYCDAVACDMELEAVFLVEITYSVSLSSLTKRLREWSENWPELKAALVRNCHIPDDWPVTPWLFVPHKKRELIGAQLDQMSKGGTLAFGEPIITSLEDVQPWKYRSWNRNDKPNRLCASATNKKHNP